jgi:hypothetical protein
MNNTVEQNIGKIVTALVLISYFEIFKFSALPYALPQMFQVAAIGLMVVLIIIKIIYSTGRPLPMHFTWPVILMMIATIPSYFIADIYHSQPFIFSLYANKLIWFYLLYFFVHLYRVPPRFILRLIVFAGLFAVVLYYIQLFMFPKMIMNVNYLQGRATIRLFVAGMIATQAAYFYFLNKLFTKNSIINLVFALLCLSIFILQGTRQLILAFVFLSLVFYFVSGKVKSRALVALVFVAGSVTLFFLFRAIFTELTKVSASQAQSFGEGIRIKAARYFLTDFMPSGIAYIFGNGEAGLNSRYMQQIFMISFRYGYYITDIGLIGDYVKYGIPFMIAGIYLIAKSLTFKVDNNILFLRFYILTQCFTIVTGRGFLSGVDIIMLLILYIFDVDRAQRIQEKRQILLQKPETEIAINENR